VAGQHYYMHADAFAAQLTDSPDPAPIRKGNIGDYDIGLQASRQCDRVLNSARLPDHFQIGFGFQNRPQPVAKDRMIIGKNDAQTRTPMRKLPCLLFIYAWHYENVSESSIPDCDIILPLYTILVIS